MDFLELKMLDYRSRKNSIILFFKRRACYLIIAV